MKKLTYLIFSASLLIAASCSEEEDERANKNEEEIVEEKKAEDLDDWYTIVLNKTDKPMRIPGIQSFAWGQTNNSIVAIGGTIDGKHGGETNEQDAFQTKIKNDSVYFFDFDEHITVGQNVPLAYVDALSGSNPLYYQKGNSLYFVGGYTREGLGRNFSVTSDNFFEFNLEKLIGFTKGEVEFEETIIQHFNSPFVQVTGGEMFVTDDYVYLIGGHNYDSQYSTGHTGIYTNAIRRFKAEGGVMSDTASLIDKDRLHRRDLNVIEIVDNNGHLMPVIFGGVFTEETKAFTTPVYIHGTQTGDISIVEDTMNQKLNLYTSAHFSAWSPEFTNSLVGVIGGISAMSYSEEEGKLVYGYPLDGSGTDWLPFSNLSTLLWSDGENTIEFPQSPANGGTKLPYYIGSDAAFIPLKSMMSDKYEGLINLDAFPNEKGESVLIGYMLGGILSSGATTTSTIGPVPTMANEVLYEVSIERIRE
ncbi:MAG: hypothetical protein ACI857_000311 [Arenicella sp.]|jgi:hypothetical protein